MVTVWWASPGQVRPEWRGVLDPAERGRLDAYLRQADRDRFLLGATIVRHAVAEQLGIAPAEVELDRSCPDCDRPHGKVRAPGSGLELSVSHSGDWVGVAVHGGGPVGLDVERVADGRDLDGIGRLTLTVAERSVLAELPEDQRPAAFTRLWCRKEAVVKLTGDGLRASLTELAVSGPDRPAELLHWAGRPGLVGQIVLHDLTVRAGHAACLAVQTDAPVRVTELDYPLWTIQDRRQS